jgi:Mn2+/Fe2+ NRAMP family transporter
MIWTIVVLFAVVAVRTGMRDPAAIVAGFVPSLPPDRDGMPALPIVISGLATAVGINMTFLYPHTLLARGWGREHREYARSDIAFGMVVPYVLVTTLMIIVAAATLHDGFSGTSISPVEAAKSLGRLLGPVLGRVLFDLGLLGMLLTTITLHMVCTGLACAEMFDLRIGSRGYRLATLLPAPGVLGSLFWTKMSVYLAVPTSIIAGALLPLAYCGFLVLQRSEAYLGADRPTGWRGRLWLIGLVTAVVVPVLFLVSYLRSQLFA